MTTEGLSIPGITGGGNNVISRSREITVPTVHWQRWLRKPAVPAFALDIAFVALAALDVWLNFAHDAPAYSGWLSAFSCAALLFRRRLPFLVVVATFPGFLTGWAQIAAMVALGTLAHQRGLRWQTVVGFGLVWCSRFVQWPLPEFVAQTWQEHVLAGIYGVVVAGMPVALGLLFRARAELSERLAELAESRDRERQLHAQAIRAEERARLAREMHDVVSHDITLIAMQAGVLSMSSAGGEAQQAAQTIRELSTRTLEELRSLVGVLRSGVDDESTQPGIDQLHQLIRTSDVPVQLTMERLPEQLPFPVSNAAYRTVQECLTNVYKHAPGAKATVWVGGEENALGVEVHNDQPCEPTTGLPSGGHGLTGLAERAKLLGGTFETEPTPEGGFRVRARYPLSGVG
ncbi:sensor histidine kinase [Amycolatopsis suaedae]|uniref:histidine kinase n=1 Tax=Amycolatopsis suaedae TaxID=2510978 RepID=A0A4V2EMN1_9PSEU|nr:histidine kinase [Amycolatopsis suaedae]RZQ65685.1 sensor histidine kinase [Amycolatopsis suaedae]